MQKLIIVVLVLAVAVLGLGYYQGWFEDKKGDVTINKEKFTRDREDFKKWAGTVFQTGKQKLSKLAEKAKSHTGEDKEKLTKEVEDLQKKHDELEKQIKAIEGAGEEKFGDLKGELTKKLEDVDKQIDDLEKKLAKK